MTIAILYPGQNPRVLTDADVELLESIVRPILAVQCGSDSTVRSSDELGAAVPLLVRAAREAEANGVDAIVVDLMAEHGLAEVRQAVTIPVHGLPEPSFVVAGKLADKFSVVSSTRASREVLEPVVQRLGMHDRLVSVRSADLEPDADYHAEGSIAALTQQCRCAVEEDGAQAILFGSGRLLGVSSAIREAAAGSLDSIPFVEPLSTALAIAGAQRELNQL